MTDATPHGRLVAAMTVEEKVAQLGSVRIGTLLTDGAFDPAKAAAAIPHGVGRVTRVGRESGLDPGALATVVRDLQSFLGSETRHGVPALVREEGTCGYAGRRGTTFPQRIGLASSFDPDLVAAVDRTIARQLRAVGCRITLSPVADLGRDPRWGRIEETYGESPTLAARLATASVAGLQAGSDRVGGDATDAADPNGANHATGATDATAGARVLATLKHFVGHGRPEGGRNRADVAASVRSLRDADLVPFRAAIDRADAASVMAAYHAVDGVPCHASSTLLTDLLRDEWGFDGTVVSDGRGIELLAEVHGVAPDRRSAGVLALSAGVDVELPETECFGDRLVAAVRDGDVDESTVDRSVRRVLREKARAGLLDAAGDPVAVGPSPAAVARAFGHVDGDGRGTGSGTGAGTAPDALAERAARRSIVLLANDGTLPLDGAGDDGGGARVAVVGPNADAPRALLGNYAYAAAESADAGVDVVTPLVGLRDRLPDGATVVHERGCGVREAADADLDAAVAAAAGADVAVACVGGRSGIDVERDSTGTAGEGLDRSTLALPGRQADLVRAVAATGTPTVAVLLNGRPLAVGDVVDAASATVEAWLPGQAGGRAIADVLRGRDPGGRLPVSVPRSAGSLPVAHDLSPASTGGYVDGPGDAAFPFGHGETYARFDYGDLRVEPDSTAATGAASLSIDVANASDRPGEEVVQLYVRDAVAEVVRPARRLVGFRRLRVPAGATATVTFDLPAATLGYHDAAGRKRVDPGRFDLFVGRSATDVRATGALTVTGGTTFPDGAPPAVDSSVVVDDG